MYQFLCIVLCSFVCCFVFIYIFRWHIYNPFLMFTQTFIRLRALWFYVFYAWVTSPLSIKLYTLSSVNTQKHIWTVVTACFFNTKSSSIVECIDLTHHFEWACLIITKFQDLLTFDWRLWIMSKDWVHWHYFRIIHLLLYWWPFHMVLQ